MNDNRSQNGKRTPDYAPDGLIGLFSKMVSGYPASIEPFPNLLIEKKAVI